jgi:HlyD family secretion protein
MNRNGWIGVGAVVVLAAAVWMISSSRADKPVEVTTSPPRVGDITSTFSAEAYVKTRSVELAPRIIARVTKIFVKEGESVSFGDQIAELYDADLYASYAQAKADYTVAEAKVNQAEDAVELTRLQVSAVVNQAEAIVASSQARYNLVMAGARPEEIAKANDEVDRAKAALDAAESAYHRSQRLYDSGAVSKAKLEHDEMAFKTARAIHQLALDTVELLEAGPTEQDEAAAMAEVEAAIAALETAETGRGEIKLREDDVELAKAMLATAQSQVDLARIRLQDADIKAPFSGVIGHLHLQVGDTASPQQPIASFVEQDGMEIEAEIGDQDMAKITVGQIVEITSASHPGQVFSGTVLRIADEAVQKPNTLIRTRIVRATIDPDQDLKGLLRSGMEVTIKGTGLAAERVLTIPSDALVTEDAKQYVWLLKDGRAVKREIEIGSYTFELTEVTHGLSEDETLILSPKESLEDGIAVVESGS